MDRAFNYLTVVAMFGRRGLKFGDENHIKGLELWFQKTRHSVFMRIALPALTTPEFRDTYSIAEFCNIDECATPI